MWKWERSWRSFKKHKKWCENKYVFFCCCCCCHKMWFERYFKSSSPPLVPLHQLAHAVIISKFDNKLLFSLYSFAMLNIMAHVVAGMNPFNFSCFTCCHCHCCSFHCANIWLRICCDTWVNVKKHNQKWRQWSWDCINVDELEQLICSVIFTYCQQWKENYFSDSAEWSDGC